MNNKSDFQIGSLELKETIDPSVSSLVLTEHVEDARGQMRYITTPIYYPNSVPHLGHAYTTVIGDVLRRFASLFGEEARFVTGLDEHGQKVEQAAHARGISPKTHVDELAVDFKAAWDALLIKPDRFIRTTDIDHTQIVEDALTKLFEKGDIYKKEYQGWYSVSEEMFYTDKDIVDGKSPEGKPVVQVNESNYFFRMSRHQSALIDYIKSHADFILPIEKVNQVLSFLSEPLHDLCISRPCSRVSWGIPLPFDRDFVTYVWFDALLNYVTAAEYSSSKKSFNDFWPTATHLIGKDILITHAVYWPTMLMALDLPLPRTVFAHGWWLNSEGKKMSKSEGEVINPVVLNELLGPDQFRYFLVSSMNYGLDTPFSSLRVVSKINDDLADRIGNLLSRVTTLVAKFGANHVTGPTQTLPETQGIVKMALSLPQQMQELIGELDVQRAVSLPIDLIRETDRYFNKFEPWKGLKDPERHADCQEVLYTCLESLRIAGIMLSPVMPQKSAQLLTSLGCAHEPSASQATIWGLIDPSSYIEKATPLFPKLDLDEFSSHLLRAK